MARIEAALQEPVHLNFTDWLILVILSRASLFFDYLIEEYKVEFALIVTISPIFSLPPSLPP